MKKHLLVAVCTAVAMLTVSCTGSSNNAQQVNKQDVEENVREFVYPLPTAFETTEMLNRIEAPYIQGICNELSNAEKYLSEDKRALNLGVYSADLCYANTYNQHDIVMDNMEVVKKIIEGLDMTSGVDPELPAKMENNENNKDELTRLISESFYDAYDYLNRSNRGPVSILIVAGSWVEALYITTHISDNTFDNKEMVKIVLTQKEPLTKLMEILNDKFAGNEYAEQIKAGLTPLYDIYSQIEDGGISEAQMDQIKQNVETLRNAIINY